MIGPWGGHGMMRGGGLGLGLLGGFLMLLLFIAIIALVVWLIVKLVRSTPGTPAQSTPQPQIQQPDPVLETLRRRLAEGAITTQEFDELRQKLGV
jgi:uncharacterized membrane protein